jgi:DNA-binding transcriptional LysR family regulator
VIAALERKPGVALFARTTRAGVLTEAGASYLAQIEPIARRTGIVRRVLVASPACLKRAGTPQTPEDLATHAVIVGPPGAGLGGWTFERDGKTVTVGPEPQLSTNVNEAATAAAVAGLGILSTGSWACRAELEAGTLVRVLKEWTMRSIEAHALFSAGRAAKAAARGFVDYLATELARTGQDH